MPTKQNAGYWFLGWLMCLGMVNAYQRFYAPPEAVWFHTYEIPVENRIDEVDGIADEAALELVRQGNAYRNDALLLSCSLTKCPVRTQGAAAGGRRGDLVGRRLGCTTGGPASGGLARQDGLGASARNGH